MLLCCLVSPKGLFRCFFFFFFCVNKMTLQLSIYFYVAINFQLQKSNQKFSEPIELFILNSSLDTREAHEYFRIDDICLLINKFYLEDFIDHEKTT
jgi:UDP-N-acetylglucosamine pyrophosphorylase